MKAAVVERYGPPEVVVIREVPKPEPGDNEVLIRVRATTVNSGDARVRALRVPRGLAMMMRFALGFSGPKQKILGFDAAGEVEAVGRSVKAFKAGDRVLVSRGFKFACHAEYVVVAEDGTIVVIPDALSFADAVAIPFGGATSSVFFEAGDLKSGESILINGASGAVGTIAIQLAKLRGAKVTALCSGRNAELVRALGADHVIDYAREDVTKGNRTFDAIMDTHGNLGYSRVKHMLKPGGRVLMVIGDLFQMIQMKFVKGVVSPSDESEAINPKRYRVLLELVAAGKIRPVIDSTFPFAEIAEAHRRVDTGRKAGTIVVTVP